MTKRRITYRRNHPEAEVETGVICQVAYSYQGKEMTWCVVPDDGRAIAAIVWWDEVIEIEGATNLTIVKPSTNPV